MAAGERFDRCSSSVTAEELASEDEFVGVDRVKLAALAALVR
jgi:hypothetical protein